MCFTCIIAHFCRNVKSQVLELALSATFAAMLAEKHVRPTVNRLLRAAVLCRLCLRTWFSICRAAYRSWTRRLVTIVTNVIASLSALSSPTEQPWRAWMVFSLILDALSESDELLQVPNLAQARKSPTRLGSRPFSVNLIGSRVR